MKDSIRLSIDVSPEMYTEIEKMAELGHTSKADIVRKSLGLMSLALSVREKNDGRLAIVNDENDVVTEIVGY